MISSADVESRPHQRLREPASPSTVPGSLPVMAFGDLYQARVATVGLNPSPREYTDRENRELDGPKRRFETLASLGVESREALSDDHCCRAIVTMRGYFDPGRPAYSWFNPLIRVLGGLGVRYSNREACHLDLVQEATDPTWSRLFASRPDEAGAFLRSDLPFLRWQVETLPLGLVVCNGRSVLDTVIAETKAKVVEYQKPSKFAWTVAVAELDNRRLGIVGWNIPMAQATGLNSQGQVELGETFRHHLLAQGIMLASVR